MNGSSASDYLYWDATTSAWTVGSTTVNLGANAVASGPDSVAIGRDGTLSFLPSADHLWTFAVLLFIFICSSPPLPSPINEQ